MSTDQCLLHFASGVREGVDRFVQHCDLYFQCGELVQDVLWSLGDNYSDDGQKVDERFELHIEPLIWQWLQRLGAFIR